MANNSRLDEVKIQILQDTQQVLKKLDDLRFTMNNSTLTKVKKDILKDHQDLLKTGMF